MRPLIAVLAAALAGTGSRRSAAARATPSRAACASPASPINIRHLWAQHLFSGEFNRFMCDLVAYPPNLPTQPMDELKAQQEIHLLKSHPEYWKDACGANIERK